MRNLKPAKLIETESTMLVAKEWGWGKGKMLVNRDKLPVIS